MGGRGCGKTRCGAETVNKWALEKRTFGLLVGRSAADVRSVMLEGESGLLTINPEIVYEPSKRRLTWPNGSQAECLYAESPDALRGPQGHWAWADEVAAWGDADDGDIRGSAWNNLTLATRLGKNIGWRPRIIATTTPRPVKLILDILDRERTIHTTGSTYDNKENLGDEFIQDIFDTYEGTRLSDQEIYGKLVLDSPAALWNEQTIEATRVGKHPDLRRVVVGVDPAASDGESAAETAIIVAGAGADGHFYVLKDLTLKGKPEQWAKIAVLAQRENRASAIVVEKNNGGEMVSSVIRAIDPNAPIITVWASDGKDARAQPISLLYERGAVHHVGHFRELENQLCSWEPYKNKKSPDRLDALVWAITDLKTNCSTPTVVHKRFEPEQKDDRHRLRRLFGMRH